MSQPAEPFLRVACGAGYGAATLDVLYAWLQSDAGREQGIRKVQVGTAVDLALGGVAVLRVPATAANPEWFPTGERQSPKDDLTFPIERNATDLAADEIWLLHQVPPMAQPKGAGAAPGATQG